MIPGAFMNPETQQWMMWTPEGVRNVTQDDVSQHQQQQAQQSQANLAEQKQKFTAANGYLKWSPELLQQWNSAGSASAKNALTDQFQQNAHWGYDQIPDQSGFNAMENGWQPANDSVAIGSQNPNDYLTSDRDTGQYRPVTAAEAQAATHGNPAHEQWQRRGQVADEEGNRYFNNETYKDNEFASDFDEFMQEGSKAGVFMGNAIGAGAALNGGGLGTAGTGGAGSTGTSNSNILLADSGQTMSDVSPGLMNTEDPMLFPGESMTSGPADMGSGMGSGANTLFPGEANPGAATTTPSSGGGLLDWLGSQAKNATNNLSIGPSDLFKTGSNLLIQQLLRNRQQQQSQQVQTAGNPLNDSQRQPFINQATNMANSPQDYLQNNPFASSLANYFKNSVIPSQVAKSGNPGEVLDRTGSQFATALGGNYNQLLQTLQGYGGFNQGNSGVAPSVPLLQGSNQSQNEAFRGLGGLAQKSLEGVFGSVTKPAQGGSGDMAANWLP